MSDSQPLVSIGLPVYNGEKHIRRALDSLLAQDYKHFELIISDNASTDATSEICQHYTQYDKRIRYFRNETNQGVLWNFKRVMELASGEYFMWAAADDIWQPQFVAALVAGLQNQPHAAIAMSAVERIRPDGARYDLVKYVDRADPSRMSYLKLAMEIASGKPYHLFIYGLYRREFLQKAFDIPPVMGGDRLFICQVALATQFCYVDHVFHIRQLNEHSVAVRYANETLGQTWRDPLANWKKLMSVGPYLARSKVIPLRRKLWVPFVALRFIIYPSLYAAYAEVYGLGYHLMGKLLGIDRRDALRQTLRKALGLDGRITR